MPEDVKANQVAEQKAPETERAHVVTFSKPYKFEGKEYKEIDLGGLEKLTVQDAVDAQQRLFGQQEVASSLVCETTTAFAMEIAAAASGMPIEFFRYMPRGTGKEVKLAVQGYIGSGRGRSKGATLAFEQPYFWKDKEYTEVDLSAISDMTIMHETAAENEMAREGVIITENSFNYLYACIIAGMATGLKKEFFAGLPLRELLNLKETVNSTDFFE